MSVAIVDYGSGNLHSAAKAFERAARESGHEPADRGDARSRRGAHGRPRGAAGRRRVRRLPRGLDAVPGMVEALNETVRGKGRPFLGICVGMQLMAERGREYEVTDGLGWIAGEVDQIAPRDPELKIPHMGWNTLNALQAAPAARRHPARARRAARLFRALLRAQAGAIRPTWSPRPTTAGRSPPSSARDNMVGTQFHPEKSQTPGLCALIANFLKWTP